MKLYNCKVNLGGSILHQVRKENVTAAEVMLLRSIHKGSNEAIVDIEEVGRVNRSDREERARLANAYTTELFAEDGEVSAQGMALVNSIFGVAGVPLPQYLEEVEDRGVDIPADAPEAPKRRGRPPKAETAPLDELTG